MGGGVDVDGVAGAHKRFNTEVWVACDGERVLAGVGLQCVGGGGEDRGALPLLGIEQPEQAPERQLRAPLVLEQDSGLVDLVAHHPVHHGLHVAAVDRGGVQHRPKQCLRPA